MCSECSHSVAGEIDRWIDRGSCTCMQTYTIQTIVIDQHQSWRLFVACNWPTNAATGGECNTRSGRLLVNLLYIISSWPGANENADTHDVQWRAAAWTETVS